MPTYAWISGHSLEHGQPTLKEIRIFAPTSPSIHQLSLTLQLGVGPCESFPNPCWNSDYLDLEQATNIVNL